MATRLLNQAGATVRSALVFCLLVGGVVALYLSSSRVETLAPVGGSGAAFIAHDGQLAAELRNAGLQNVTFTETATGGKVAFGAPDATECNDLQVAQAQQMCAAHRVQSHRDSKCAVAFTFQGGSCGN